MRIAFIGLGNMGAPMAANLVKAGHEVTGFDPVARPEGLRMAATAAEAATGAEIVITMLPNGAILSAVASEVLPVMPAGSLLCDCSTVEVDAARKVAGQAAVRAIAFADAPVSGGIGGAAAGTLTFMVGAEPAHFDRLAPVLAAMGKRIVPCGVPGAGQAAKICNNMILGVTMIATCEAFALADKLGLDRQALYDVVSTSSGQSWTVTAYCPAPGIGPASPADNGYKPGFAAELMLKDLTLSQSAAEAVDADTPMGALARTLYHRFVTEEDGKGRDFSAMLPRFSARGRGT